MRVTSPRWFAVLAVLSSVASAQDLGLDLSETSTVQTVVLTPAFTKVVTQKGGFAGFDSNKTADKLDPNTLKKLIPALQKELGANRVIALDATLAAYKAEGLTPTQLRAATSMARMAKATNAAWAVQLEVKGGITNATLYNLLGEEQGKKLASSNLEQLAKDITNQLVELSKPKPEDKPVVAAAPEPVYVAPPPPEADVEGEVDAEIALDRKRRAENAFSADPANIRAVVLIGAGAQFRNQQTGSSASIAQLRSNATPSAAVYAAVSPLQFFEKTRGGVASDLTIDVNYRRAFVRATASGGGFDGQSCSVTDDDLQLRGTYRYKLGGSNSMLPAVGVSGAWSQDRTTFTACDLPVVSATYRGIDAQLRVKQPVYRQMVSLDLAVGPRFLLPGPTAERPGFSIAGELWLEVRPASILFVRGGARLFRAQLSDSSGLSTNDLRVFAALEAGVFL